MIFKFVLVPAGADAEHHASAGNIIDARGFFGQQNGVALGDQANAGSEQQLLGHRRHGAQSNERVQGIVILLRQIATTRERGFAAERNVGVLGQPHGFKSALFERDRELGRGNGVVGWEHHGANLHGGSPLFLGVGRENFSGVPDPVLP